VMIDRRKSDRDIELRPHHRRRRTSGAVTALYAARRGLRILLLDKSRFPRDKICGDAISGKAISILRICSSQTQLSIFPVFVFARSCLAAQSTWCLDA
jgi:hypothetical protein